MTDADIEFPSKREFLKREQLEKILSKLRDKYAKIRENAARGLGVVENPEAVPALINALKDDAKEVRSASLRALSEIGSKHAIDALISCLSDPRSDIRSQSAHFLGATRAFRSAPKLKEALRTERDLSAKEYMLEAIGRLRDESALPLLASFLNDKESSIRWSATWAIGMIGRETKSKEAVGFLLRLERHHDRRVQHEAATALRMISPKQV